MGGGGTVTLSKRSQDLIADYLKCVPSYDRLRVVTSSFDVFELIRWLSDELTQDSSQEVEFILASLRAELLHDLFVAMPGGREHLKQSEDTSDPSTKLKFIFLAICGTLLAACEGFDSITTMLVVLPLPSIAILLVGLIFSVFSVIGFYVFDLIQISKHLGVELGNGPKLLDAYVLQMKEIKAIRRKINGYHLSELSSIELTQLKLILSMLQKRFHTLISASLDFDLAVNSSGTHNAKMIISLLAGSLYFSAGFCAGQTVAMFIAGLFIATVTPTFWPVVLFSILVGLAAFALYWYVERPVLKKWVSGWFGLDKEKIDMLCNKSDLDKEEEKLQNLKEKIVSTALLVNRVTWLEHKSEKRDEKNGTIWAASSSLRVSTYIYSFMPKPDNVRDSSSGVTEFSYSNGSL